MNKLLFLSLFVLVFQSFAQEKKDTITTLKEVVIEGRNDKAKATINRAGIKAIDLPQAIQIIDNEVIFQQQSIRLSDVIKNANGVYVGSARGGAQESFWSRGYDMSSNNMFKNGFRFNSGSIPEVSSLERIELLKGSAALLYGNVAPGGILNMVTKMPNFKKGGEITMQTGSYNFYKPTFDWYGTFNKNSAFRLNGAYENSESFRDFVTKKRYYINPSVLFKVNHKTEIMLQADYFNDDWTPDFGTSSIGKEIANIPRNTYLGTSWASGNTKQTTASVLVMHQFNKQWKLNFNASFQDFSREWKGTERIQPLANGDWNRPLAQNKTTEQIFANQLSFQGCFKTGSIKHQLFTGIDTEKSETDTASFRFFNATNGATITTYDTVNIFNPSSYLFANEGSVPPSEVTRIVSTITNRYGVYVQDLISITQKLKVLAGIRYSYQEAKPITINLSDDTQTSEKTRIDRAFTPKMGFIYQPNKLTSFFGSFANSFIPNTGVTIFDEVIAPSIIDQYEMGVKKEWFNGKLTTNATLYHIMNSNLAQTAEFDANGNTNTNTNVKALSGETTSKGIELEMEYHATNELRIMAGYSYNDMRYTKTSGKTGSFIEGDRLVRTPVHTANASFFYTFQRGKLKNLSIGAISNYIGNRIGGWNNQIDPTKPNGIWDRAIPIQGYTTLDLSLGYSYKNITLLCKISNLTNELNYTVHENYSVNPIAPRQIISSLRYQF